MDALRVTRNSHGRRIVGRLAADCGDERVVHGVLGVRPTADDALGNRTSDG